MRTWDILDETNAEVQVTHVQSNPSRPKGLVSSAVHVAFAVSIVIATSAEFRASGIDHASQVHTKMQLLTRQQEPSRTPKRGTQVVIQFDAAHSRTTAKLGFIFGSLFEPAQAEEPYEDDYSFS